ncbi:unnamed protein product [Soboliphyme baturini]|uniref:Uncharacterized protein n=1 Tax=Soboliphyme baturini TaxID=241478 RepID=A0A183I9U1_9BILA|nr:unnamed protein product [Soboliphyme baturini]
MLPSSETTCSSVNIVHKFKRLFSSRMYLALAVLAIANFSNSVIFSCIAPFYPKEVIVFAFAVF